MSWSEDPWKQLPNLIPKGGGKYVRICDSCGGESKEEFTTSSTLQAIIVEWAYHVTVSHKYPKPTPRQMIEWDVPEPT